jgi:hypothetical protein
VKELEAKGMLQGDHSNVNLRQAAINSRWADRVNDVVQVPYTISGSFPDSSTSVIEDALRDLGERSKVVEFVPHTSQGDYISVVDGSGCSSFVGRKGGEQELTLLIGSSATGSCIDKGIIQHEFLHALGFNHEQSRADRDTFVTINYPNIEEGKESNFEKVLSTDSLGRPYDYGSVMHYGKADFSQNGQDTISAPQPIGQRDAADEEDIRQLRLLYQCSSGAQTSAEFEANPCTSNCKCWEGAIGCNENSDACQGGLVCSSNTCVQPDTSYQDIRNGEDSIMCMDLKEAETFDGNQITLHGCNGTPAQEWYHEAGTSFIRSAVDPSKCLAGSGGNTDNGTALIINTCFDNDERFMFIRYTDGSIRPVRDDGLCVGPSGSTQVDGNFVIQFSDCDGGDHQKWDWY